MKKNKQFLLFLSLLSLFAATSCDDTTETIGAGLSGNMDHFAVSADTFLVTTNTELMGAVQSRSASVSLGRLRDYDTGSIVSSSITTQFYLLTGEIFPEIDSIRSCEPKSETDLSPASIEDVYADSTCLYLYPTNIIGDSLQPLHLNLYELDKPIPDGQAYSSDFAVRGSEYLSAEKKPLKSLAVTFSDCTLDSAVVNSSGYSTTFRIPMNDSIVARDGVKYKNYGTYIMQRYYKSLRDHDGCFDSYNKFAHNVCPGFYIEMDNGEGAMATIDGAKLNVSFRYQSDTLVSVATTSMFATDEVLQTNCVNNDVARLLEMAAEPSCTYLKTPAGLYTVATLPVITENGVKGIMNEEHSDDSISCVKLSLQTMRYEGLNGEAYPEPSRLVMIPADSVKTFFEESSLGTGYSKKAYIASYSSTYGTYDYTNCAGIISFMYQAYKEGVKENPNWVDEHPNWNKVALVPVTVVSDASGNVTSVYHDMSFTTTKLVRGDATDENRPNNIKISVIYTKLTN